MNRYIMIFALLGTFLFGVVVGLFFNIESYRKGFEDGAQSTSKDEEDIVIIK